MKPHATRCKLHANTVESHGPGNRKPATGNFFVLSFKLYQHGSRFTESV
jgi:hypothetical protein